MTAERIYPGGWAKGIGWVAVAGDLDGDDLATDSASEYRTSFNPAAFDPTRPVIVTRWADGTVPSAPVAPQVDGLVTMLERRIADRVLRADHYRTSGRITEAAVVDGAINAYRDVLDLLASGVPSTPQAPDEKRSDLGTAVEVAARLAAEIPTDPHLAADRIVFTRDTEDGGWVVAVGSMPGCFTQGDTFADAARMVADATESWAEVALPAPSTSDEEAPSGWQRPDGCICPSSAGDGTDRYNPPECPIHGVGPAVPVVPEEPSEDTTPAPPDTDEPVCTCERAKLGGHPRTSTHATDCPWTAYRAATPAPVADVEPQPAPVDVLAMPEWAALVWAVSAEKEAEPGYPHLAAVEAVCDIAESLVAEVAARSAAGSTEA